MSTVLEIEQAIERLPEREAAELRSWFLAREARPALAKWREHGSGVVRQAGGVDAYLCQVRGDEAGE